VTQEQIDYIREDMREMKRDLTDEIKLLRSKVDRLTAVVAALAAATGGGMALLRLIG